MTGETVERLVNKTVANFPMQQNINTCAVAGLWLEHFCDRPDDLMEKAFKIVLAEAKYWPTVRDIREAIAMAKEQETPLVQIEYAFKKTPMPESVTEFIGRLKNDLPAMPRLNEWDD